MKTPYRNILAAIAVTLIAAFMINVPTASAVYYAPPPPAAPPQITPVVLELEYAQGTAQTLEREIPEDSAYFAGEYAAEAVAIQIIEVEGDTNAANDDIGSDQVYYLQYAYGFTGEDANYFKGVSAGFSIALEDLQAIGVWG